MDNTLRTLRKSKGYSGEEFSARYHISISTLMRAEKGLRVRRNIALRIAEALGKEADEIADLNFEGKRMADDVQSGNP